MSSLEDQGRPYANASDRTKDFLISEAQRKIDAQMKLFDLSDRRATGLLQVAGALTAAALAVSANQFSIGGPLLWAAATLGIATTGVAGMAAWALWPSLVNLPGWEPEQFKHDIEGNKDWGAVQSQMIAAVQNHVDDNDRLLGQLGWRTSISMIILGLGPVAGAGSGLLAAHKTAGGAVILTAAGVLLVVLAAALWRGRHGKD
jgi:hypothetical protein